MCIFYFIFTLYENRYIYQVIYLLKIETRVIRIIYYVFSIIVMSEDYFRKVFVKKNYFKLILPKVCNKKLWFPLIPVRKSKRLFFKHVFG